VAQARHLPYGQERWTDSPAQTDFTFTGQRADNYTHLIEMGARWYDPYLNRWISADTIVPQPGDPQSLNRYSYVHNNALRYVDPSGHGGPGDWLIALGNSGPEGKALVVGMAEVAHKANQYRDDIFFPTADTTFEDRLEASTVVGGGPVLVAGTAIPIALRAIPYAAKLVTAGLGYCAAKGNCPEQGAIAVKAAQDATEALLEPVLFGNFVTTSWTLVLLSAAMYEGNKRPDRLRKTRQVFASRKPIPQPKPARRSTTVPRADPQPPGDLSPLSTIRQYPPKAPASPGPGKIPSPSS
jgi:RHS repeat-associated protein